MMPPVIIAMPGNERLAADLARTLQFDLGHLDMREFPDGETYLRFTAAPDRRVVIVICTLDRPNGKLLPLLFAASTARELGAARVGLVAPYLAYMRQDRRFKPGEAVTSREVASLLSNAFDWMVTVDPHLHRYGSLDELYEIPTRVLHAAPLISSWIKSNVRDPLIIGPDSESEQWVAAVAKDAGGPCSVLEKVRRGDREVEIKLRDLSLWQGRTPVLVDDIISTGRTMIEAVHLLTPGWLAPVCIAVHGLFADNSDLLLEQAGARVITTNSVLHRTNRIELQALLAGGVREVEPTR
jgi:ribose-phosphate pyrophosphokinase